MLIEFFRKKYPSDLNALTDIFLLLVAQMTPFMTVSQHYR